MSTMWTIVWKQQWLYLNSYSTYVYSPIICSMIFRSLCLISISTMTICCHVPSDNLLSLKGIVRLGPIKDALTCEYPFPSCQVLSCLYSIFFGAVLDNILGKSDLRPGSYSIVVTAEVEPAIKIVTIPCLNLLPSPLRNWCGDINHVVFSFWPNLDNLGIDRHATSLASVQTSIN